MPTTRASAEFAAIAGGIKLIAANAVKRGLAPFALKPAVVTAVVIQPEEKKPDREQHAVDNGACGQIEHAGGDGMNWYVGRRRATPSWENKNAPKMDFGALIKSELGRA